MEEKPKKECRIIGYGNYIDKDTGCPMLRVIITTKSNNENYYGRMVPKPVFLEANNELENKLKNAIDNDIICYYSTTDNIMTGYTKIENIYIK